MEFDGSVYKVLPVVKGTSARGEWVKQDVVFELPGEYSRKACVSFWGDKAEDAAKLREGEELNISVNIESREFNGRWFTELRAWKITRKAEAVSVSAPATDFPPIMSDDIPYKNDSVDDIPF